MTPPPSVHGDQGCNAWCEPVDGIHTIVAKRSRAVAVRAGTRARSSSWGPCTVVADAPASHEAATGHEPGAVLRLVTYRYDTPPPWYRERPPRRGEQSGHDGDDLPLIDLTEATP